MKNGTECPDRKCADCGERGSVVIESDMGYFGYRCSNCGHYEGVNGEMEPQSDSQPPAETIYAVYANAEDRRHLLGHAIGDVCDIEAFYDDRKIYGLDLEQVKPKRIPAGYATKRSELAEKKDELLRQIEEIDKQINGN